MGWKKFKRSFSKFVSSPARVAAAAVTLGGSEAARSATKASPETAGRVGTALTTMGVSEITRTGIAGKGAQKLTSAVEDSYTAAAGTSKAAAKSIITGQIASDPIQATKDILAPSIKPIKDRVVKSKSEMVLDEMPSELTESAEDRAERERREFLTKKRQAEKGGRGFGRTILTQRSGAQPTLLGGL